MKQVEDVEWAITCVFRARIAIDLTSQAWKAFLNEFSDSIEVLRPLYARLP